MRKEKKDYITILIVDDHRLVREGLCELLKHEPDMKIIGEAENAHKALKKAYELKPDIVLLDISMPKLSGLSIIPLIKEKVDDLEIVVMSIYRKELYIKQVLASGAMGYVHKSSSVNDISRAIRAAYKKEYFLCSKIESDVIKAYLNKKKPKSLYNGYELLTDRERQVFRMIVEGCRISEIADILCLSSKTIEKHRWNLMNKLNIHSTVELVKFALENEIIDFELCGY